MGKINVIKHVIQRKCEWDRSTIIQGLRVERRFVHDQEYRTETEEKKEVVKTGKGSRGSEMRKIAEPSKNMYESHDDSVKSTEIFVTVSIWKLVRRKLS